MSYFKASLQKFQGPSKYINNVITLSCDGEEISLPEIQGLIFTNIPSWGSGNDVWKVQQSSGSQENKWQPQNISDGVLECIGTGFQSAFIFTVIDFEFDKYQALPLIFMQIRLIYSCAALFIHATTP
jgi:hypothetical protein